MDVKIDYRRIGSYLAGARRRQGLKQKQVADLIDVANNTVSNMERGQQELNLERIVQLCILYEIKPGDVLNDCCDELIAMDTPQQDVACVTNSCRGHRGNNEMMKLHDLSICVIAG